VRCYSRDQEDVEEEDGGECSAVSGAADSLEQEENMEEEGGVQCCGLSC
jgi:hypothetical protein